MNSIASSVVAGGIRKRRQDDPGGYADYELIWPGGVADKLKYVFQSQFFERIILPDLDPADPRRRGLDNFLMESKSEQSTEINFVTHLQHAADAFQIGGWRQFRYVRCPDIGWRVHPSGTRLPSLKDGGVQACIKALQANTYTVWELPVHLGVTNLAAALWHINMTLRNLIEYDRPPMMSWAFVRAIPNEQDERFWHVVWKQLGASAEEFEKFHQTATSTAAANKLAQALNVFSTPQTCPSHRAPDILVLVGTDHLSSSLEKEKNPLNRCHAFDPVQELLRRDGVLQPNCFPAMCELVGQTRIIVIRSDEFLGVEQPQDNLELEYEPLLSALRVFRFGFTEYPGWFAVNNLLKSKTAAKDACEMAMDLLDAKEETGTPPHPVQLLTAVRAVEQRWDAIRQYPDPNKDEVDHLRSTIDALFDQARAACASNEWLSESNYNLLPVVSQRATFLYSHRQILLDADLGQRVEALSSEAWKLLAAGTDGSAARGEWYEIEGDRRSDDGHAETAYRQGVRWVPGWRSLWFKHIGCLSRMGKSEAVSEALATLTPELLESILKSGIGSMRRDHKRPSGPWMKLRWQSGITKFKNWSYGDPALRGLIKLYVSELSRWK